jgi:uncharacterized protein YjiS (DUF1127 family)
MSPNSIKRRNCMGTIHTLPVESARVLPHTHHSGPTRTGLRAAATRIVARVVVALAEWAERYRTREQLLNLDDRTLRDIGVTRDQAREEAHRTFRWL